MVLRLDFAARRLAERLRLERPLGHTFLLLSILGRTAFWSPLARRAVDAWPHHCAGSGRFSYAWRAKENCGGSDLIAFQNHSVALPRNSSIGPSADVGSPVSKRVAFAAEKLLPAFCRRSCRRELDGQDAEGAPAPDVSGRCATCIRPDSSHSTNSERDILSSLRGRVWMQSTFVVDLPDDVQFSLQQFPCSSATFPRRARDKSSLSCAQRTAPTIHDAPRRFLRRPDNRSFLCPAGERFPAFLCRRFRTASESNAATH